MNRRETSKHEIISNWIRAKIDEGTFIPGEKIPSENELSNQFGYSRQTVRQAIGTLVSEGILIREQGSGTFVQKKSTTNLCDQTMRIGVITTYLDDYIFPGIIHGIEEVMTNHGYTLSLGITYNKPSNEEQSLRQILQSGVDGLIIESAKSALPNRNEKLYKEIRRKNIPMVFINGYYNEFNKSYVVMDDVKAGEMVTDVLRVNGHKNIGGIFKSDDIQGVKRYEGMMKITEEYHLPMNDRAILWYTTEDLDFLFNGQFDNYILERFSGITGIVCYNDQIAANLIQLFKRNQVNVYDDISIVSFDNSFLAEEMVYNLTSIDYPAKTIGNTAAKILVKSMKNTTLEEKVKLKPTLVMRHSVKEIE